MNNVHELKCEAVWFSTILDGSKTFEVRHDDRAYETDRHTPPEGDDHPLRGRGSAVHRPGHQKRVGANFRGGYGCDLDGHVVTSLLPLTPKTAEEIL